MTASLFTTSEHVQGFAEVGKCHRSVREKGTVTKAKSLFVGKAWKLPQRNRRFEKCREIFATKIQWPEVGQIPGAGGTPLRWPYGYVLL